MLWVKGNGNFLFEFLTIVNFFSRVDEHDQSHSGKNLLKIWADIGRIALSRIGFSTKFLNSPQLSQNGVAFWKIKQSGGTPNAQVVVPRSISPTMESKKP